MQKTYLYLMVCVIGAMSLASCSEDSISPDAGGDGDGDSTTEVPLAQVAKPKPNPWLAQEEYSITHFNSAQTDAFSSAVKDGTFNTEMVFVCGWNDASGWEVTGLDWKSGATRHRSILGKNNRANGAYAIIQYLANGDLLFNSVAGPIRVKY